MGILRRHNCTPNKQTIIRQYQEEKRNKWASQGGTTMGKKRPERDTVEAILKEGKSKKAHQVAEQAGLIDAMGYDKAVDYVKRVRRSMREKGTLKPNLERFGTDEGRLEDFNKLFALRKGRMSQNAAYHMLLMNCYLRLRSQDDDVHMDAIDDTYRKNEELEEPFHIQIAIHICEIALERYMWSIDERRNQAAIRKGLPHAGLSYANETLISKCEITENELQQLKSIKRENNERLSTGE